MRPFKKDSLDKYDYEYYEDSEGKIRKVRKMEYQPRSGYIRIKFLDKLWVKWRRSSYDSKLLYLPWMLGFATCYVIYKSSMMYSQREIERDIKARLPFQYKREQAISFNKLIEQQKKLGVKVQQPKF